MDSGDDDLRDVDSGDGDGRVDSDSDDGSECYGEGADVGADEYECYGEGAGVGAWSDVPVSDESEVVEADCFGRGSGSDVDLHEVSPGGSGVDLPEFGSGLGWTC